MKKALLYASVASMIDQFNMENIVLLQKLGYKVSVGCNFDFGNNASKDRIAEFKSELESIDVDYYNILVPRSIFSIAKILRAYRQTKEVIENESFSLVHCHSPVGGVLARLACRAKRKSGLKLIYTAHGFHFYKGASWKNWFLYYPVESLCSHFTDVLVTINTEDYEFAKKKIHAKSICYIPGIGINCSKFETTQIDRMEKRRSLGIPSESIVLLSVGELNGNKNHEVVLRALAAIDNDTVHYVIAGLGVLTEHLRSLAKELGIENRVHLLGFRKDIPELLKMADVFCFPSYREGMPVSALEAMAAGLPLVASSIRGVVDCCKPDLTGYLCDPSSVSDFSEGILSLLCDGAKRREMGKNSAEFVKKFDRANVNVIMNEIYAACQDGEGGAK